MAKAGALNTACKVVQRPYRDNFAHSHLVEGLMDIKLWLWTYLAQTRFRSRSDFGLHASICPHTVLNPQWFTDATDGCVCNARHGFLPGAKPKSKQEHSIQQAHSLA